MNENATFWIYEHHDRLLMCEGSHHLLTSFVCVHIALRAASESQGERAIGDLNT